jgi:hypothetical protein
MSACLIRRTADSMWLINTMESVCPVPTCLWGERKQDAKVFDSLYRAEKLSRRIGGCVVVCCVREGDAR